MQVAYTVAVVTGEGCFYRRRLLGVDASMRPFCCLTRRVGLVAGQKRINLRVEDACKLSGKQQRWGLEGSGSHWAGATCSKQGGQHNQLFFYLFLLRPF